MPLHEAKPCPRCRQSFECKARSIGQCNCTRIILTEEEKAFIAGRYEDCLCLPCLKDLKNKYIFFREKYFGA
jgi:hypothetical protein